MSDVAEKEQELQQFLGKLQHCPWQPSQCCWKLPQRLWQLPQRPWKAAQCLGKPGSQVELPPFSRVDDDHRQPLRRKNMLLCKCVSCGSYRYVGSLSVNGIIRDSMTQRMQGRRVQIRVFTRLLLQSTYFRQKCNTLGNHVHTAKLVAAHRSP